MQNKLKQYYRSAESSTSWLLFKHLHPCKTSKQSATGYFSVSLKTFCIGVKDFTKYHKQHGCRPLLVSFFFYFLYQCSKCLWTLVDFLTFQNPQEKKVVVLKYTAQLPSLAMPRLPNVIQQPESEDSELSIGVRKESSRCHHLLLSISRWMGGLASQPALSSAK